MRDTTITVIKLGGSLLDSPSAVDRVAQLLAALSETRCLIFPGGGTAADLVRDWQQRFSLSDDAAHWLAVDSLSLTGRLWQQLIPGARLVRSRAEAEQIWQQGPVAILDPADLLRELDQTQTDVAPPHHWDVTSDSLAGWIAWQWPADRLILAKSCNIAVDRPAIAAGQGGAVDPYFAGLSGRIERIGWWNVHETGGPIDWLNWGRPVRPD